MYCLVTKQSRELYVRFQVRTQLVDTAIPVTTSSPCSLFTTSLRSFPNHNPCRQLLLETVSRACDHSLSSIFAVPPRSRLSLVGPLLGRSSLSVTKFRRLLHRRRDSTSILLTSLHLPTSTPRWNILALTFAPNMRTMVRNVSRYLTCAQGSGCSSQVLS